MKKNTQVNLAQCDDFLLC